MKIHGVFVYSVFAMREPIKAEQETVITFNEEDRLARITTSSPRMAKYLESKGYTLREISRTPDGDPTWVAQASDDCIQLAKVVNGQIVRRQVSDKAKAALARGRTRKQGEA